MKCAKVVKLLVDYLEGSLDEPTRKIVDQHLSVCENCAAELASLRSYFNELGSLEEVTAPDNLLEKVHARLERRIDLRSLIRWLFIPFHIKIPLELAATAIVILLVISISNFDRPPEPLELVSKSSELEPRTLAEPMDRVGEKLAVATRDFGKPIELALLVKTEAPHRDFAKSPRKQKDLITDKTDRAMKKGVYCADVSEPSRYRSEPGGMALRSVPSPEMKEIPDERFVGAKPFAASEKTRIETAKYLSRFSKVFYQVTNLVEEMNGRVLTKEHAAESLPHSISTEIPPDNLHLFLDKLQMLGELKGAIPSPKKYDEPVRVRIQFISPD